MKEITRTLVFVIVAGASVAVAAVTHFVTRPAPLEGFEQVGEEFYPDFVNPSEAKSLRVVAYSEDTATVKEFNVEYTDGLWRIPSHHYYPADAEDRLADTAASVIGINRGALVSRRESDHQRFNVIDPLSDDVTELKGRGKRITLTRGDGTILSDLIIGNEIEDRDDHYYVRRPDETAVYLTELNIDLTTKFSEWIEDDLLKLQRDELREIVINRYSVDESKYPVVDIVDREVNRLARKSFSDPWKLEGLDEDTEELKTDDVRELVATLDDLRIVGVRPKPQGLNPDLTLDERISSNPLVHRALLMDLANKGFLLAQGPDGELQIISNEGEATAATNQGVVYELRFGEIFTGDETEIEIGSEGDQADGAPETGPSDEQTSETETDEPSGDQSDGTEDSDQTQPAEENVSDEEEQLGKNRYLFVTVRFDEKYVSEKPVEPVKPEPPPGLNADTSTSEANDKQDAQAGQNDNDGQNAADPPGGSDSAATGSAENGTTENAEAADENAGSDGGPADSTVDSSNGSNEENAADGDEPKSEPPDPKAEYEEALQRYEQELEDYERAKKDYEEKLEEGRETVDDLNERFSGWYYVISAESFESLRLSREDLVKPKEKEDTGDDEAAAETALPQLQPAGRDEAASPDAPDSATDSQDAPADDSEDGTSGGDNSKPDAGADGKSAAQSDKPRAASDTDG